MFGRVIKLLDKKQSAFWWLYEVDSLIVLSWWTASSDELWTESCQWNHDPAFDPDEKKVRTHADYYWGWKKCQLCK